MTCEGRCGSTGGRPSIQTKKSSPCSAALIARATRDQRRLGGSRISGGRRKVSSPERGKGLSQTCRRDPDAIRTDRERDAEEALTGGTE